MTNGQRKKLWKHHIFHKSFQNIKYIEVTQTKQAKYLYDENIKIFRGKLKKISKGRNIFYGHGLVELILQIDTRIIYKFSTIPTKILTQLLTELQRMTFSFTWKHTKKMQDI